MLCRVFNVTGGEVVIIILAALVILGPEKLPDVVRRAGRLYGELRRMSDGFQSELRSALDEPTRELRDTAEMAKSSFTGVVDTVKTAVNPGAAIQGKVLDAVKGNGSTGDKPGDPAPAAGDAPVETPVQPAPVPAAPSWSAPAAEAIGTAALPPPHPALQAPPAAFPAPVLAPPAPSLPPPSAHEGA
jgi:sec-independent protein translocase protein TatB